MYLVGAEHPNKSVVLESLPRLLHAREELVTGAEAFQEIIHRYKALRDGAHLNAAYDALEEMTSAVLDVTKCDTDTARIFSLQYRKLSARDSIHLAVMKRIGCRKIWSFDGGFDVVTGFQRIE